MQKTKKKDAWIFCGGRVGDGLSFDNFEERKGLGFAVYWVDFPLPGECWCMFFFKWYGFPFSYIAKYLMSPQSICFV